MTNSPAYPKIKKVNSQMKMMRKMKRKMMKIYGQPKLRSFEAFVTEIEISIFGFENSTLPISMNFTLNLQK